MVDKESQKQPVGECRDCSFHLSKDDATGLCRRYPPQVVVIRTAPVPLTVWPTVAGSDTCGEFKYAPGKKPKSQFKPEFF